MTKSVKEDKRSVTSKLNMKKALAVKREKEEKRKQKDLTVEPNIEDDNDKELTIEMKKEIKKDIKKEKTKQADITNYESDSSSDLEIIVAPIKKKAKKPKEENIQQIDEKQKLKEIKTRLKQLEAKEQKRKLKKKLKKKVPPVKDVIKEIEPSKSSITKESAYKLLVKFD